MAFRRMLPLIILNVIVSAVVVLALLYWWDNRQEPEVLESPSTFLVTSPIPTIAPTIVAEVEVETLEEIEEVGPKIYIVQRGDTLGSISNKFDVPMIDIMDANGIENPNFLQVNQELIIPIYGLDTPNPEATSTMEISLLPSPIPTVLQTEGEAVIELGELISSGDISNEAVSIINNGDRPIALIGWKITDEDGHAYTFGQITLFGEGAAIAIHTTTGQDGPTDLYWGNQDAVWQLGETITLVDSEGTARATLVVSSP
jgi:LysM repeat protein